MAVYPRQLRGTRFITKIERAADCVRAFIRTLPMKNPEEWADRDDAERFELVSRCAMTAMEVLGPVRRTAYPAVPLRRRRNGAGSPRCWSRIMRTSSGMAVVAPSRVVVTTVVSAIAHTVPARSSNS